ncbi:hypothetical protein GCM10022206_12180 [Streptomyces chiangmaiensis]
MASGESVLEDVHADIGDWTVAEITDAGTRVGYVAVVVADDDGALVCRIRASASTRSTPAGGTSRQPVTGPRHGVWSAVHAGRPRHDGTADPLHGREGGCQRPQGQPGGL